MYKFLIVDDEIITRKGLMNHINWDRLGISEVNMAASGREAINFLKENPVDMVLSDVRMPGMNGIEMCTEIRALLPECQIIFLSGYSDKEYLKGAIELEAVSYVEKPINISEIETAIEKAITKIENTREKEENYSKVVEEGRSYFKATFLQKLITGRIDVLEARELMGRIGLSWNEYNRFNIAIIKAGNNEIDIEELALKMDNYAHEVENIYYIKDSKYIVYLFAYREEDKDIMKEMYIKLSSYIKENAELKINGAFGCTVSNILHSDRSYNSAAILMQQLFFSGYGKTVSYTKEASSDKVLEIDESIIDSFKEAIDCYNSEKAYEIESDLFEFMKDKKDVLVGHVKGVYFRFVQVVLYAADNTKTEKAGDSKIVAYIWEKLNGLETLEECREYLVNEMKGYFENTKDHANNSRLIIDIMEYIKNNYGNPDLCLTDIADNVFITPNYMNTLFKKQFGKTVGQYITDVRMDAAKKLIMDRKIKLADVAEMVGYNDPGYFTKVFRKNVGINPKDYRER